MGEHNSILLELVKSAPGTILQVNAGVLSEFAEEIVSGVVQALNSAAAERKVVELLTIDEVSEMLKVSKMTLHRWDKSGFLKKIDIGGHRRYRRSDVEAITEKGKLEEQWLKILLPRKTSLPIKMQWLYLIQRMHRTLRL